ncbi:MAG TPA: hypothetical protein VIP98_11000 [Microlunatus sp.]
MATALQHGADADVLQRVLDQLPAMSIGYEPALRPELLRALACFADLTAEARSGVPAGLAAIGWYGEDIQEAVEALSRVRTDPRTPEEWVVHDAYAIVTGVGRCVTPWGVHLQTHPDAYPPRPNPTAAGDRLVMLDAILNRIAGVRRDHPMRVAVDGGTAAGKTSLAQELAGRHVERGGAAIRASFDFFKIPPQERARQGFGGRVFDSHSLIKELLQPLGPGGSRRYRVATYDSWMGRSLRERPPFGHRTRQWLLLTARSSPLTHCSHGGTSGYSSRSTPPWPPNAT